MATDPSRSPTTRSVNLPDVDPCEDIGTLDAKAERCRRLATGISDRQAAEVLIRMAQGYQEAADRLRAAKPKD